MTRRLVTVLLAAVVGLLGLAPAAHAATSDTSLAGTWNSASLRQDGVGYKLRVVKGASGQPYTTKLRMIFQDGKKGPVLPGTLTVNGSKVTLRVPTVGTLRGTIGQDGSIFFATCNKKLDYVTKADADTMCLFQEFPR